MAKIRTAEDLLRARFELRDKFEHAREDSRCAILLLLGECMAEANRQAGKIEGKTRLAYRRVK